MKEQIIRINSCLLRIWPLAVVVTGLLLSASITFASFSLSARKEVVIEKPVEKAVLGLEASHYATPTPSPEPSVLSAMWAATPKPSLKPSPSVTPTPTPAPTQAPQNPAPVIIQVIQTPTPSPSPVPSPSIEPSLTPLAKKITIEIKQPDTQINFDLEISENLDVCRAMQKAKDEGKVNSLTISDKYLESFGTLFVEEINGYKNNWVFTLNSESPIGCTQTILKDGDKLAWEFLSI